MDQKEKRKISVSQAQEMLLQYSAVFDIVRFVDPISRRVLVFEQDGTISRELYCCYKAWNKIVRCENCISIKAQAEKERCSKYEFVHDDIFQAVATPFTICDWNGGEHSVVLELVNNVTDEIVIEAFGKTELMEKINETNKKIYQDSLTQVYNRRYFDERVFCFAGSSNLKNRVSFIMADLKKFKNINDIYGHDAGDRVLAAVGKALTQGVRATDTVIRLGGDEFLIVLKDCPPEQVPAVIEKLRKSVHEITYAENAYVNANFGWAFTTVFYPTDQCIKRLLREADNKMYAEKAKDTRH